MLSINYISNFLSDKQTKIDASYYYKINNFEKKIDKTQCNLKESFEILFNKSINDFYYDNSFYKNKSQVFTLINSIFSISDEFFKMKKYDEKEVLIKEFIKKIDHELFEKDLYNKFGFNKNRNFNKSDIQIALKEAFIFKTTNKFDLLVDYICHYLGINLYILEMDNNILNITKSNYFLYKYNNNINKFLPHFIILIENEIYKPILMYKNNDNNVSSIICYSKYNEIIDNIWKYFNINDNYKIINDDISEKKYCISMLKDLKLENLKNLCIENNIDLLKKSEKTSKMINKIKIDLINDLLKL